MITLAIPHYRLFILGAGFSNPAGLPLAAGLLRTVRENFPPGGVLEHDIKEWSELYPGEKCDLERVLAYSHMQHYLRLKGSKEYFEHDSRAIVFARPIIQETLIDASPWTSDDLYRRFAQHLTPNDVVLTFNYDTLLEQALDEIGKSYSLTPKWWLVNRENSAKYINLLKLHGSIDWYDRRYHDFKRRTYREEWPGHDIPDDDPIFGPNPTVPTEPLSRGQTEQGFGDEILSRVFRVPDIKLLYFQIANSGCHSWDLVPFMLPLAYDKLLGYEAIAELWSGMHRTMDAYSSITIIGYSMPKHDNHAYEALGRLLVDYQRGGNKNYWGHRRVPIQIVTLAASAQDALTNIPFLKPDRTKVWHEGFGIEALQWLDWGDGDTVDE